jgi:hypothetical protein
MDLSFPSFKSKRALIFANLSFSLWTYILVDTSSLNLVRRLVDIGYADSVNRFCRDAFNEKLARAVKDHEILGKLLSDTFGSESGYSDSCEWSSYEENIDFHIQREHGLPEEEEKQAKISRWTLDPFCYIW